MLKRSLLLNILLMLAITAALLFAFFKSLTGITKHGQEAKVPNVTGHQLKIALKELEGFELHIDSIYVPYKDPLEIIYQEPIAGSIVKKGRIIFISVNKQSPPTISMPKLVDLSFRNAVLTLQSYRLIMGDTIFKPDLAAGAVLSQMLDGREIAPGVQVPVGSKISLVVGAGLSDSAMAVPDLIGRSYAEAYSTLVGAGIEPNIVWDGSITDSQSAIVYEQFPESKNELDFINYINAGELMDLRIMQKPSEELLRMHRAGSQRYIDPNDTNVRVIYGPPPTDDPDTISAATDPEKQARRRRPKPQSTGEEINNILQDGQSDVPPSYDPQNPPASAPPKDATPAAKPASSPAVKPADAAKRGTASSTKPTTSASTAKPTDKLKATDKAKLTDKPKPGEKPKPATKPAATPTKKPAVKVKKANSNENDF
jgi:eukaryotic-like serine/threonine-protein kinase